MKKLILVTINLFLITSLSLSAQEAQKDTLYFKLDGKYIFESKYDKNFYLLEDSSDVDRGTFLFQIIGTESRKNPKEVFCLKNYVRSSKHYDKHKKIKLNDYRLWEDLNNYTIYLVRKGENEVEYIQVIATVQIE